MNCEWCALAGTEAISAEAAVTRHARRRWRSNYLIISPRESWSLCGRDAHCSGGRARGASPSGTRVQPTPADVLVWPARPNGQAGPLISPGYGTKPARARATVRLLSNYPVQSVRRYAVGRGGLRPSERTSFGKSLTPKTGRGPRRPAPLVQSSILSDTTRPLSATQIYFYRRT